MGYDFEIHYKVGLLNRVADALSRRPDWVECGSLLITQWWDWDKLRAELKQDVFLTRLVIDLAQGTTSHVCFQLKDDLLFYKGRLVIPRSSFVPMILAEFTLPQLGATPVKQRRTKGLLQNYTRWACVPILLNLWLSATYASETRGST